jgi:hypothetical protein
MFAILKFTYFRKGLFQILHILLALAFIGLSQTYTQLLHHSRTHTQTHTHTQSLSRN